MSRENETIIPWYLRVLGAPFLAIGAVHDWWVTRKDKK